MSSSLVRLAICVALAGPLGSDASADEPSRDEVQLPAQLSLDDALRIFRERGYDLLLADAAVEAAAGDAAAAAQIPNPTFLLQGSYSFSYRSPYAASPLQSPATPWGVTAGLGDGNALEDAISGKRGLRKRVAAAALASARLGRLDAQRTLEYQVKSQYIAALLARDLLDFANEIRGGAEETYRLMHVRYAAGAVSEADEAKVELALLEAEQSVDSATEALRVAKLGLAFLLGVRGKVPTFHVSQDLPAFVVPPALAQASVESLLADAWRFRPDLRQSDEEQRRAAAQVTLARRLRVPDISLNVSYQQQTGSDATAAQPPTFAFGVQGTLPVFYLQRGEILRAEADLRAERVRRARLEAQISTEVETALQHFASSRKQIERMETRLLDRAKRTVDLVEIQYQKGAASLLELLDARRQWIANNEEHLQYLAAYWNAVFQLEQAVGRELR